MKPRILALLAVGARLLVAAAGGNHASSDATGTPLTASTDHAGVPPNTAASGSALALGTAAPLARALGAAAPKTDDGRGHDVAPTATAGTPAGVHTATCADRAVAHCKPRILAHGRGLRWIPGTGILFRVRISYIRVVYAKRLSVIF